MIHEAYRAGQHAALEKLGLDEDVLPALAGAAPGLLGLVAAPIAAESGRGWRTLGGTLVGKAVGNGLGRAAGGNFGADILGNMVGGGAGAYIAHSTGKSKSKSKR